MTVRVRLSRQVELQLAGSRVTCVGLSTALAASAGASLTALHLDGCRRVDDAALRRLPALVPALRHLTLAVNLTLTLPFLVTNLTLALTLTLTLALTLKP